MDLLGELKKKRLLLKKLRAEYQIVDKQFNTWLYWAIDQDFFSAWQYENAFKSKALKNPRRYDIEIEYDEDTGQPLLGTRHLIYLEKERTKYEIEQLLMRLWKDEVPLIDIAQAYEEEPVSQNGRTTYKAISRLPGFKVRNELLSLSVKKAKAS